MRPADMQDVIMMVSRLDLAVSSQRWQVAPPVEPGSLQGPLTGSATAQPKPIGKLKSVEYAYTRPKNVLRLL